MSQEDQDNVKKASGGLANVAVNYLTGGLAGMEDGKLGKGVFTRAADETVGEISGRNVQRKAQMDAKDAIDEEKQRRTQALRDQQTQKFQQDVNASSAAQAAKDTNLSLSKNSLGTSGPEKDFLGL